MTDRRLQFDSMCTGPDDDKARFHEIMAKFYRLAATDQRVFMAMFEALLEEQRDGR